MDINSEIKERLELEKKYKKELNNSVKDKLALEKQNAKKEIRDRNQEIYKCRIFSKVSDDYVIYNKNIFTDKDFIKGPGFSLNLPWVKTVAISLCEKKYNMIIKDNELGDNYAIAITYKVAGAATPEEQKIIIKAKDKDIRRVWQREHGALEYGRNFYGAELLAKDFLDEKIRRMFDEILKSETILEKIDINNGPYVDMINELKKYGIEVTDIKSNKINIDSRLFSDMCKTKEMLNSVRELTREEVKKIKDNMPTLFTKLEELKIKSAEEVQKNDANFTSENSSLQSIDIPEIEEEPTLFTKLEELKVNSAEEVQKNNANFTSENSSLQNIDIPKVEEEPTLFTKLEELKVNSAEEESNDMELFEEPSVKEETNDSVITVEEPVTNGVSKIDHELINYYNELGKESNDLFKEPSINEDVNNSVVVENNNDMSEELKSMMRTFSEQSNAKLNEQAELIDEGKQKVKIGY